jgi:hypothetical protein
MKTALQELIDSIKEFRDNESSPLVISRLNQVLLKAASMLEKEKSTTIGFATRFSHKEYTLSYITKEFEETFNTK